MAPPHPEARPRTTLEGLACGVLGALVAIGGIGLVKLFLPPQWRPDLVITNTGVKPVAIRAYGQTTVVAPAEAWRQRFRAEDTVQIHAAGRLSAPVLTVKMPAQNPVRTRGFNSVAQLWTADVCADEAGTVRLENRWWQEVTIPASPTHPWPDR